ncbi:MAG: hypothetical protein JNL94_15915 [Planctomycetes bacterium]|nr:hypothetical protein [Planctomycetota bacterium]
MIATTSTTSATATTRLAPWRTFGFALITAAMFGLGASAFADTVHLKNGSKLEGKVKSESDAFVEIETAFGVQKLPRADVVKIERGVTAVEQLALDRKALQKDDVAGRVALWKRAGELKQKKARDELEREILALDPQQADVNRARGNVLFDGKFVTPAEKDRLERAAREADMLAQGLVPHEGGFVTPEEKAKLDAGFVKRGDRWLKEEEAKALDGLVKAQDGTWIKREDAAVATTRKSAESAIERTVSVAVRDHAAAFTDVSDAFAGKLADTMEKGFKRFAKEFALDEGLQWFGPQRVDLVVFRTRFDYERFCDWIGANTRAGTQWAERAKKVAGVYLFETWPLATTYVGNRGEDMAIAHCCNMLGHVLLNRYRFQNNGIPPFFDEAFAALTEFDLTGRNAFFNVGAGRYERHIEDKERAFFEDGKWMEPLRDGFRTRSDTPMDQVVRREHVTLSQMDVAKGMALYQYWRTLDPKRMKQFFDALRDAWPSGNPPPTQPSVFNACQKAFNVACSKDMQLVDEELRAWVMKKAD